MAALSAACPLGATHALRGTAVAVRAPPAAASCATRGAPLRVRAGNEYENGVFTPLVIVVRNVMGVKPFNQFRGKAISLHSQVRRAPRRGGGEGARRFGNLWFPRRAPPSPPAPLQRPLSTPRRTARLDRGGASLLPPPARAQQRCGTNRRSYARAPLSPRRLRLSQSFARASAPTLRFGRDSSASRKRTVRRMRHKQERPLTVTARRQARVPVVKAVFGAEAASKGRTCSLHSAPGRSGPVRCWVRAARGCRSC